MRNCHCEEPFDYAQGKLCDEAISKTTLTASCFANLAMTKRASYQRCLTRSFTLQNEATGRTQSRCIGVKPPVCRYLKVCYINPAPRRGVGVNRTPISCFASPRVSRRESGGGQETMGAAQIETRLQQQSNSLGPIQPNIIKVHRS